MRECTVVLKMAASLSESGDRDYIGADRGALHLAEQGIRMVLAIGDFDSVSEEEMKRIREFSDEVMALNPIKDDSDSEAAVDEAVRRGYEKIYIAGAFGGRIDHEIVNLRLCFKYPERVILTDPGNRCIALKEGTHVIKKEGYRYLSVFAQKKCEISLKGFKYPLDHRVLDETSLYGLSNEILEEEGIIEVHSGMILVIMSRDKA